MLKRLLAISLCVCMMISVLCWNVSAAKETGSYETAFNFLVDLGIADPDLESLENVMSREEFAVYMTKMLRLDTKLAADVRYFRDVEPDGYAVASINMLTDMGLISVGEDREFRPQEGILTEEVAKLLVTALGYSEAAAHNGGYPVGYVNMAMSLGILKGVDLADSSVSCGKAFAMMQNAMEAPILSIEVFSSEGYVKEYVKDDEYTILSTVWGLEPIEGTVTAVFGSSMDDTYVDQKDEICINGVLYTVAKGINTNEFLGEYVKGYYSTADEKDNKIMSLRSTEKTKSITIVPEDFKEISENTIAYYNEAGNERKVTLDEPVYIYNGSPLMSDVTNKLSNINKGSIVIKDSDGDGRYDLVIVKDYENFVVSVTDAEKTYSKLGDSPIIWAEYESIRVASADGLEYTPADIKPGQSLSVARSVGGDMIEAIMSETLVTGNIEASKRIDDIYYVVVNGNKYFIDKSYAATIKDTYLNKVSATENFEFLIDAFGNVAYMVKKDSAMHTGYVIAGAVENLGFEDVAKLRILTEGNKIENFDLADNMRINESRYSTSVSAFKNLPGNSTLLGEVTVKKQIIRYMLNGDGEINRIFTASPTAWNGTDEAGFLQILEKDSQQRHVRGRMGKKITFSDSSLIFFIPRDETDLDEKNCGVSNYSILGTDSIYLANGYLFSKDSIVADAAVCYYTPDQLPKNSLASKPIMMVSEISKVLGEDGEVQYSVAGFVNGGRTEVKVPAEVNVDEIEVGDIVMFSFDYQGNVESGTTAYEILVKRSDIENNGKPNWTNHEKYDYLYNNSSDSASDYYRSVLQLSFGHVLKTNGNAIAFDHELDGIFDETVLYSGNVMVYDSKKPEGSQVYTAKVSDILTYESAGPDCGKIILRTLSQVVREAFIYQ